MAANWTDFIASPTKASKRLHSSKRDVAFGQAVDEQRIREVLRRGMRPETPAPHSPALSPQELAALRLYEQRRRAEPPRAEGALGIIRQQLPQFFRDNQQLADTVGDLSLKEGALGTAGAVLGGALPVALGSGLTGAATGAGMSIAGDALMDESARKILGSSIQDPLSSGTFGALAGGTGKIIKPLIAAMGASSGDAEAGGIAGWLKRALSTKGATPKAIDDFERLISSGETPQSAWSSVFGLDQKDALTRAKDQKYRRWLRGEEKGSPEEFVLPHRGHGFPHDAVSIPFTNDKGTALTYGSPIEYMLRNDGGWKNIEASQRAGMSAYAPSYLGMYDIQPGTLKKNMRMTPEYGDLFFNPDVSAVRVRGMEDIGPRGLFAEDVSANPSVVYIKRPELIRTRDAVFDPDLVDHPYLKLAGGGAIKRLGKRAMSQFDELRPSSVAPQGALSVVKPKGGNWLAGSVEDALRGLQKRPGVERSDPETFSGMSPRAIEDAKRDFSIDRWIEGPLTKYVKTRMASPEDEVRRLAEEGVLHFEPYNQVPTPAHFGVAYTRANAGFPTEGVAQTSRGKQWEELSDRAVATTTAGDARHPNSYLDINYRDQVIGGNPWLHTLPAETPVYYPNSSGHINQLGFPHLIDELSNALDPNSGLPRHLQLTPEAVKNMSMEKAVRRVADINAHRAAVQAAANAELANKAMVVREYTDPALPNPKGLRWVELKAKKEMPPGYSIEHASDGSIYAVNPTGDRLKVASEQQALEEAINNAAVDHPPYTKVRDELAKQLKYEGDTMGHCVGGYCPDVLEGRSRIFSLRDAKGEPHVTVEVGAKTSEPDALPAHITDAYNAQPEYGLEKFVKEKYPTEYSKYFDPALRIVQIKGKQNRAPNPEYLPFVQDFVRNSPLGGAWSDVGDLQNTGLRRVSDAFNTNELKKLKEAGIETPLWADKAQIEELHKQFNLLTTGTEFNPARAWERMQYDSHIDDLDINLPDRAAPFAHGGAVTKQPNPADNFQGIIAAIEEALA